jgi:hypothetical protein
MLTTIAFGLGLGLQHGTAVEDPDEVLRVDISIHEEDDEDDYRDLDFRNCASCRIERRMALERELAELQGFETQLELAEDEYEWDQVYFMMGVAPAASFNATTFHPHLRYDMELGFSFWNSKHDRTATLGVDGHVSQFLDRTIPGGGADVVGTAQFGHFYARAGVGVLTGVPFGPDPEQFRPAVGGVVGVGATVSDGDFGGRIGVDYDARVDRGLGFVQTVLLTARFTWGF